jgi:hypothetical protein
LQRAANLRAQGVLKRPQVQPLIEEFLSIASRDDAEAFAITHGLSRAFLEQNSAPRALGAWRGLTPFGMVQMTLHWFEPINLGIRRIRMNKATLRIDAGAIYEAIYEDQI